MFSCLITSETSHLNETTLEFRTSIIYHLSLIIITIITTATMADLGTSLTYAGHIIVAILTGPPVLRLARSVIRPAKKPYEDALYQDEDGVATQESMEAYSIKRWLVLAHLGIVVGLAASFLFALSTTLDRESAAYERVMAWILFGSWVSK